MILLLAAALAAPPDGFSLTKSDVSGCELYKGSADAKGDVPMRAECRWADISLETFHAKFSDWEAHDDIFSSVVSSRIQRSGDPVLVHQRHYARGISDREILLWGKTEKVGDGWRFSWSRATGETLTPASGNVAAERSDGAWEAHPHPDGGVTVTYELTYDPGGSVPGFLVRSFQGSGFAAVVTELHDYLK
ncbi:MAG: hypothetical protein EP330_06405 [Deltaproteobacteria bacterium]|nr:MAG: hypothetical protein EP330_06405 [Deltaproteobacteria bacterium]